MQSVRVFKMPGLFVDAVLKENGKVILSAGGLFQFLARPFLSVANKHLDFEKPAKVTDSAVYPSAWLPPIPSPVFNRLVDAEIKTAFGKFIPETVSIETTRKFNPNAENYARKNQTQTVDLINPYNSEDPSGDLIKNAIDQALDLGAVVITFTEGDPLLNPNIADYIRYVDKSKAVVMAYTWGLDFDFEKAKQLKEAGLQTLLVSIYSTDPKTHDEKRNIPGAYEKAIFAIRCGLEAGLLVTMATHADENKVDDIEGLWELACELGVHEFSIWESVPTLEGACRMTEAGREKINDFYRTVNSKSDGTPRLFSNTIFEGEMFGAIAGRRWLHVTTEGEMQPDPYIPFSYGNIHETSMKSAWKKMRKESVFSKKRNVHALYDPAYLQKVRERNGWDFKNP
ncbi:MAG: radical SAM protein [Methanimicrococcus sp.]|nr:radical SAM protein [Methanimicrococcus sp.]